MIGYESFTKPFLEALRKNLNSPRFYWVSANDARWLRATAWGACVGAEPWWLESDLGPLAGPASTPGLAACQAVLVVAMPENKRSLVTVAKLGVPPETAGWIGGTARGEVAVPLVPRYFSRYTIVVSSFAGSSDQSP